MNGKRVMNRWLVVFGAVLIQLCLGAIYAWSVFTPALSKAGWTAQDTQLVFSVGLATFAVVMVWAGRRLGDWGPRKLAMLGGVVLGAGYVLAGFFGGTSVWALTILLGLVGGAGIGLGYVVPIAVGMRWFPDRKGMITGLAVAGFGFGAMGWIKLAGEWGGLIANLGLSTTFVIYGVAFALLVVVGGIWMVYPPEGWKPEGYEEPESVAGTVPGTAEAGLAGAEMLRSVQFPMIFITFVFSAGAGLMTIGLMKLYPVQALVAAGYGPGEADALAGTAMAVYFSLANGVGRIAWA